MPPSSHSGIFQGFHGYVMVAWIYGLFFGSYLYISKIFCYSIVRSKEFSRTWSIVQAVQVTSNSWFSLLVCRSHGCINDAISFEIKNVPNLCNLVYFMTGWVISRTEQSQGLSYKHCHDSLIC